MDNNSKDEIKLDEKSKEKQKLNIEEELKKYNKMISTI